MTSPNVASRRNGGRTVREERPKFGGAGALPEETIRVRLNGKERDVPSGLTVGELLESLELQPSLVVVEHNREILSRDAYRRTPVEAGDSLELVHFVGGG